MSKLAVLFKGEEVHLPAERVIKAKQFSALLEAIELLPIAQKDAEEYKQSVVREVELSKEVAEAKGFQEGMEKWGEQLASLQKQAEELAKEVEGRIAPIAVAIAKKLVGYEIEMNEGVRAMISQTLKSVTLHKRITIYVNPADIELLEAHKAEFKKMFEELEVFSFQERPDIDRGGCIVETEAGIIDAQLPKLWQVIEKNFERLLQQEKDNENSDATQ